MTKLKRAPFYFVTLNHKLTTHFMLVNYYELIFIKIGHFFCHYINLLCNQSLSLPSLFFLVTFYSWLTIMSESQCIIFLKEHAKNEDEKQFLLFIFLTKKNRKRFRRSIYFSTSLSQKLFCVNRATGGV